MTDEEIIKALECCWKPMCGECPSPENIDVCRDELMKDALELIKRQQKKIEHYKEARNKLLSASKLLSKQVDEQQEKIESLKKTSKSLYEAFEAACDFEYKIRRKAITEFTAKLNSGFARDHLYNGSYVLALIEAIEKGMDGADNGKKV